MMVSVHETAPPPAPAGIRYRPYRGLDDIPGMARANAALRARCGVLEPVDAEVMAHRYRHLVGSDPGQDCLLAELDGRVVAYGRAEWRDRVDGLRVHHGTIAVDPDAWGRGVARDLLGWLEARHHVLAAAHPSDRPRWVETEARDGDDDLAAAVTAAGYTAVRRFAEMLRPRLDEELPDHPLAVGYEVRPVTRADLRAVWEMEVVAFRDEWGEEEAVETDFASWIGDPRLDPGLIVVAFAGGAEIASVVEARIERLPDGRLRGLLDGVATHPAHRRRGLARALIARSLRVLREMGATSAYLGVDTENRSGAFELYESCGFEVASGGLTFRKPFEAAEP